jgi:hypothetical protein
MKLAYLFATKPEDPVAKGFRKAWADSKVSWAHNILIIAQTLRRAEIILDQVGEGDSVIRPMSELLGPKEEAGDGFAGKRDPYEPKL